jgi:hypothetical protein
MTAAPNEWKIYFDGKLYNSYLVGKKEKVQKEKTADGATAGGTSSAKPTKPDLPGGPDGVAATTQAPAAAPPTQGSSSDEKTMKDLGF